MELHDEEMTPNEFESEDAAEFDFGIWPEIAGLAATIAIIGVLFATSAGGF